MRRASTKLWIILTASAAALGIAAGASAYFQAPGAGIASASASALAGPSGVTAAVSGPGAVGVSWTAPTPPGGGAVTGYYVERLTGTTPTAACGSSATSLLSPSTLSCSDTGRPSGTGVPAGSYTYQVVAVWRSWSTPSAASSPVTVLGPTVSSAAPAAADQGATNLNVTIAGTNFISGAAATFSGSGITVNSTTFVSATSVTANITILGTATTGARSVTVTNPDGDAATAPGAFTVNAAPSVTAASPSALPQGASSQTITITGTGFDSGPALAASFSGTGITVNSTTYVSATSVTANITILGTATTGARNLTLTNGDGSSATKTGAFTVNAAPTVTSTSPSAGDRGATNYDVTTTGTNFVSGAAATFSGSGITVNSTTFVSATSVTANITILGTATTGARSVTVTNPDGGSATAPVRSRSTPPRR